MDQPEALMQQLDAARIGELSFENWRMMEKQRRQAMEKGGMESLFEQFEDLGLST